MAAAQEVVLGHFFTKYGLDANVLIDLILYPKAKAYFKQKGYSFPDKFLCTLPQIIGEVKGVLINKYKHSTTQVNDEINRVLKEFFIEKLPRVPIDSDIFLIEEKGVQYGLNEEDVTIIYGFWKLGIQLIMVRDTAFEKTCKDLNIKVVKWPRF